MPRSVPEDLALRWVPGEGPVTIQTLASGLVNDTYRVARAGRLYSLRVAADVPMSLDREWECRVLACAAAAGLAPAIECCRPAQGILVAEWMSGHAWTPEEIRRPDKIRAITGLLRRVHSLPIPHPARAASPAAWIAHYTRESARGGLEILGPSTLLRGAADACVERLAAMPSAQPVLCHSDLHRLNVSEGTRLVLLDWEYAHVSDPYWDLAGWIANNDGTESFAADVLTSYLQRRAGEHESARLRLYTWLYDYVCLLWSELYLRQRPGAPGVGVSARAEELASRLRALSGSRAPRVPAH